MHTFVRRVYAFGQGLSLSAQVKEMYRSGRQADKETHEESKSFTGSVEPETTKCTSWMWLGGKRGTVSYSD